MWIRVLSSYHQGAMAPSGGNMGALFAEVASLYGRVRFIRSHVKSLQQGPRLAYPRVLEHASHFGQRGRQTLTFLDWSGPPRPALAR